MTNFLGGVASLYIGRLQNDSSDGFRTRSYGLYFTDNGLTGVSYKRVTSRAYWPGCIFSLVFAFGLATVIAYARLAGIPGNQNIPYGEIWGPIILGSAALSVVFLVMLVPNEREI